MNFFDNELEWYYHKLNNSKINSVDDISQANVPTHMLVIKKNTLEYGQSYNFIVKCEYQMTLLI